MLDTSSSFKEQTTCYLFCSGTPHKRSVDVSGTYVREDELGEERLELVGEGL